METILAPEQKVELFASRFTAFRAEHLAAYEFTETFLFDTFIDLMRTRHGVDNVRFAVTGVRIAMDLAEVA